MLSPSINNRYKQPFLCIYCIILPFFTDPLLRFIMHKSPSWVIGIMLSPTAFIISQSLILKLNLNAYQIRRFHKLYFHLTHHLQDLLLR